MDMGCKRKACQSQNRTLDFDHKNSYKFASKLENTYTTVSISEPAFYHFFQIGKIPLYAQVMAKKPRVGQNDLGEVQGLM